MENPLIPHQTKLTDTLKTLNPKPNVEDSGSLNKIVKLLQGMAGGAFGLISLQLGDPIYAFLNPFIDKLIDGLIPDFEKEMIVDRLTLLHKVIIEQANITEDLQNASRIADRSISIINEKINTLLEEQSKGNVYDLIKRTREFFDSADEQTHKDIVKIVAYTFTNKNYKITELKQLIDSIYSLTDTDRYILFNILKYIPENEINIIKQGSAIMLGNPINVNNWRHNFNTIGLTEKSMQNSFLLRIHNAGLIILGNLNEIDVSNIQMSPLALLLNKIL